MNTISNLEQAVQAITESNLAAFEQYCDALGYEAIGDAEETLFNLLPTVIAGYRYCDGVPGTLALEYRTEDGDCAYIAITRTGFVVNAEVPA